MNRLVDPPTAQNSFGLLLLNKDEPLPPLTMAGKGIPPSIIASIFLGFSSAMLGGTCVG